ncbi:MAG TPA: hypothetical protein VJ499_08130, partial [Flavisolibacter sp.]|nr:hypothetical protein [Flavisolibacter sp.]
MTRVQLKRKIANRILNGHPWIFANEVDKWEGDPKAGDVVDVYFSDGKFAGKGYFNPQSQIIIRLLTTEKNIVVDDDFFLKR